jgi:chemotaxis signal transduction protein
VGELPEPSESAQPDFLLGTMIHDGELLAVIDVPRIFSSLQPAEV